MATQESSSCEIIDSWEDLDEKQILARLPMPEKTKSHSGATINKPTIVHSENSYRAHYVPPEPLVRILKRPSREERLAANATSCNGKQLPVKTLQQREAEYAQARLRILGEANSPEDEPDGSLVRLLDVITPATSESSVSALRSQQPKAQLKILQSEGATILREPRGPPDDFNRGFNLKR